ncbi:hypothetical protein FNAPI_12281, partial [Fusarium napiforme]
MTWIPRVTTDGGRIADGCEECRRAKALIDVHNQIRISPDLPDELKLYFIVEAEEDSGSYYSGVNGLARLTLARMPEEVVWFLEKYCEKADRLEISDD